MTRALRPRAVVLRLLVLAALLVGALGSATSGANADHPAPLRVMLMGDSITHGAAGDWTWRYRLWQEFAHQSVPVDFVGPRDDLWDNVNLREGSHDYLDPDFDQDHAAFWGNSLTWPRDEAVALTQDHSPDVVVILLGVNDLVFAGLSPAQACDAIRDVVVRMRAVDPDIKVVLAQTPLTWKPGVPAFNDLLDLLGAELPDAAVADTDTDFTMAADTWDDTHPSATGEVKIAAGVVDAFADLGVLAPARRPLSTVINGPRARPELTASVHAGAATLTWTMPPGVTKVRLWRRLDDGPWHSLGDRYGSSAHEPVAPGSRTAFRVQPIKYHLASAEDMISEPVTLHGEPPPTTPPTTSPPTTPPTTSPPTTPPTTSPPATAPPTTAPPRVTPRAEAPRSFAVKKQSRRLVATWRPARGATRYRVLLKVGNKTWTDAVWTRGTQWRSPKLKPGVRYVVQVRSYRGSVAGHASPSRAVRG